jgi:SAM-dependent methyltransferase
MSPSKTDIFASAPLRDLLAEEAAALAPDLQRCTGAYALQISAAPHDRPPALPMLACWTRLHLAQASYGGDLRARADEPLPFADDAFGLVLLRHALEVAPSPQDLLAEAARVLAPGGMLALTGMHPASGWLPWLLWRGCHRELALNSPFRLSHWLHGADLTIERVRRIGPLWPAAPAVARSGLFGGGYVLVARKRRHAALPIRLRPQMAAAPVGNLAPGARRNAAA